MAEKDCGAKGAGTEEARAAAEEIPAEAAVAEPAPPADSEARATVMELHIEAGQLAEICASVASLAATVDTLETRIRSLELRLRHTI